MCPFILSRWSCGEITAAWTASVSWEWLRSSWMISICHQWWAAGTSSSPPPLWRTPASALWHADSPSPHSRAPPAPRAPRHIHVPISICLCSLSLRVYLRSIYPVTDPKSMNTHTLIDTANSPGAGTLLFTDTDFKSWIQIRHDTFNTYTDGYGCNQQHAVVEASGISHG